MPSVSLVLNLNHVQPLIHLHPLESRLPLSTIQPNQVRFRKDIFPFDHHTLQGEPATPAWMADLYRILNLVRNGIEVRGNRGDVDGEVEVIGICAALAYEADNYRWRSLLFRLFVADGFIESGEGAVPRVVPRNVNRSAIQPVVRGTHLD